VLTTTTKYTFKDSFSLKIVPEFQISDANFVSDKLAVLREYSSMITRYLASKKTDERGKSDEKSASAFRDTVVARTANTGARDTLALSLRQSLARDSSVRKTSMYVSLKDSRGGGKKGKTEKLHGSEELERKLKVSTRDSLAELVMFCTPNSEEKDIVSREVLIVSIF
jgi:hypothetical protein